MHMALANFPEHMCHRTPSENDTFRPTITDATFPVIIDSGASVCYTNDLSDFTSKVKSVKPMDIQGIASNLTATATGNLTWLVEDSNGTQTKIETQALYVPGLPIRLLSPQHLAYTYGNEPDIFTIRARTSTLKWNSTEKIIHHYKRTNLPTLHATNEFSTRQLKYHLLFDDKFETIRQQDSGKPKTTWNKLYFKQILANNIEQPKQSIPSFNETPSDEERTETKTKSGRISKPPSRLTYAYYSETLSDTDHSDDTKASSHQDPGLKAFISSLEDKHHAA